MGRYYEEFEVGKTYPHGVSKTITEADCTLFNCLTMNYDPLYSDEEFARKTPYGGRIVNPVLVFGLVGGQSVREISLGTTVAAITFEEIELLTPLRVGDTLYSESYVADKRESRKRPDAGLVFFEMRGFNQRGETVIKYKRVGFMWKQSHKQGDS